ncbi:tyrosine-type recombinase/integrase [Nonomuraea sp. H19]|uniref:tyrosine-type recombinase/integrase n=1 Tax=Nonomuraea sp. H19 TaxID=3452206 RepID=UPI003F8C7FB7
MRRWLLPRDYLVLRAFLALYQVLNDGASRTEGPLFLSERHPVPARRPPPKDLCPHTVRARLGYDRVRVLLEQYAGLEPHQLRHSAAAHLGDSKTPLHLIMAKTRHKNPRTAMRYVRPGGEAIAEVTGVLAPPRRAHWPGSASRTAFRTALGVDDTTWTRGRGWALATGLNAYIHYAAIHPRVAAQTTRQITEALIG